MPIKKFNFNKNKKPPTPSKDSNNKNKKYQEPAQTVYADEEEEEEARKQALRTKKMVDHLAVAKPEFRKELVEAKQIANAYLEKFPEPEDEEPSPPRTPPPAPIEYIPEPSRSPSPVPAPPPANTGMRPAKPRVSLEEEKISFKSVHKSFCKNMADESDSE